MALKYSANHTQNIFEAFEVISSYIKFDSNEKHFRGKCAEVFLENGKYFMNCHFCGQSFINIKNLFDHIYKQHFILDVPDNWDRQQKECEQQANKIIKTDPQNILFNSEIKVDSTSYNKPLHNDKDTFDFNKNATKEFTEEITSKGMITSFGSEIDNVDIPNTPVQYRDSNGLYPCTFCTISFKNLENLEKHFIQHTYTSTTGNESKADELKNDFYEYIKGKRHKDGRYHCEICNRKYSRLYVYRAHFLEAHKPHLNPYKCPDCPLTYTVRYRYEVHRRTHTKEKPYKCPHCPRAFALSTNLTRHINIHLGKKPYKCVYCGKGFTQKNSQQSHERNIHTKERPHQCELCGKSFPRSTLLKEHWKRHTNTRAFKCEICFKSFFNNHNLQAHRNRHTGIRTYDCELCPRKFRDGNTLKAHKKLHLDKKEYKCKLCNREFAQKPGLYGHMKLFHKNVTCYKTDELNVKKGFE